MVKTNKRLFKRRVSTSEVVLINRTASLYLPPLRQFFTPRFYHIQGLHPHLLVTNIITCYHIHVFFCYKKLLSPTLYTRRLFSDGTDIDGCGVLPILRNNEMVKLDNWRWCPVDTVHWYWYQSIPVYWFWNQPYLVPQLQGGLWWRGWFPWQRPEPLFPCSNLQLAHQPGGIGQFDNEVLIVGRCRLTFPDRDMSRLPTAVIRLGTTRGRIKAFNIRKNSSPELRITKMSADHQKSEITRICHVHHLPLRPLPHRPGFAIL